MNNKEDLDGIFKGRLNEDTWRTLKNLIQNFFTFSSKFIQQISKDKELMDANNAAEEDAELVYTRALSAVNFISHKL